MSAAARHQPDRRGPAWRSLRVRLTVLTAAVMCLALVAGAWTLGTVLQRGRLAALDGIVAARVDTVAALVAEDRLPDPLPVEEPGEVVQVLDAQGRVVASSSTASRTLPVLPADLLSAAPGAAAPDPAVMTTSASAYADTARAAMRLVEGPSGPVTVVATMPLTEVRGLLRALQVSFFGVVPTLTLLVAIAVWLVLGRALGPVDQLRRAAAQVASTGGRGVLPVGRDDDEIAALARTLNDMLDRLDAAAGRQRSFVADAAHELRSPLSSLRATIEVAADSRSGYTAEELAEDLAPEVLRMGALVDDLLLLARLGSAPRGERPVDLAAVAAEGVAAAVAGGAATDGPAPGSAEVPVHLEGAGATRGDASALARVVRNLVENARRHATSRVEVHVAPGLVVVDDDGGGIDPADRERVFERFVRLDAARERGTGGSGLGLAIAREIAREHGGDVVLGDSPLGGLRAQLRLRAGDDPAAVVPPPADAVADGPGKGGGPGLSLGPEHDHDHDHDHAGGTMGDELHKGDEVTWKSHGQTVHGEVEKKITSDTEAAGRTVRASKDDPQYLVKSDKTGKEAVHKPSALTEE
ncbi:HVA1 family protein [Cellulomonas marina]|uniref:histidine kinase n=1 Tax=Cellulomonas marina TaxID=988821 RepID=A0A1I0V5B9_9CELL|nr:HVA1 family protein [Cellulomonas marina]GIG28332.1 two-component sensor histidine kinase [Cellulomonas marina]SFA71247.1 Signal transduction histidine kinase [Cellulomonas marina]